MTQKPYAKKLIAFDYDETLSVTSMPLSEKMSYLLKRLLERYEVCIISGGTYESFSKNIINRLDVGQGALGKLHLMPMTGTRYYRYDMSVGEWTLQYREDLTPDQRKRAAKALEQAAREFGIWEDNPRGVVIDDRSSQVTYAALGKDAQPDAKYAWERQHRSRRGSFRDRVASIVPDLEVRVGGTTSTDITAKGIDKAYGISRLMESLSIDKGDVLFIGDRLQEGGNDYPVKKMGVECIEVTRWQDTTNIIEDLLSTTE